MTYNYRLAMQTLFETYVNFVKYKKLVRQLIEKVLRCSIRDINVWLKPQKRTTKYCMTKTFAFSLAQLLWNFQ